MKLECTVNGEPRSLETPADKRAVDLLREDLGLTGVKEACGQGECGACTVLVDGESRLSCLTLAAQLQGKNVITIEGLTNEKGPHPIQEAFVEHGAAQCGFCTPGMIMATADLLTRDPAPDRAAIRQGLSGNLCRCTGYQAIVDAVEATAAKGAKS